MSDMNYRNDIVRGVIEHSGKCAHPRIMLTQKDFDRIRESEDIIFREGMKNILSRAEEFMGAELTPYVIPDGIRLLQSSRMILDRSLVLGMAYRLSGDERYAERLWRELEHAADFKDWNPRHFLDVGEMCCAFGIGYDWIYDRLSESQRKKLRRAIVEKAFGPVMDDYLNRERSRTYRWYQDTPGDNWKFVCNGGLCVGMLAICDEEDIDGELCQTIFDYGFENTYRAVRDMYCPDGSYVEGFMYWNYATTYLGYYTAALKSAVGTDFGLTDWEPVLRSAFYLRSMCSGRFISFNFGDASESNLCLDSYMFLGKNYARGDVMNIRAELLRKNPRHINPRDIIYYTPLAGDCGELPLDCGSVGGTNASFRSGWGEDDLFAAIHFGKNNVCHAHLDMGTFVVEWGGKRFICDLGGDNYNVPDYSLAYRYRAEGHNTVVINPPKKFEQVRACESYISVYRSDVEGDSFAVCDMSVAYEGKRVVRGMKMTSERGAVIVRDELVLDPCDTVYWFAHTRAKVTLSENRRSAVLDVDGVRMWAGLLADGEFSVMPAEHLDPAMLQPTQNDNSAVRKLAIKLCGSANISVCFIPLMDGEREPGGIPEDKELALW